MIPAFGRPGATVPLAEARTILEAIEAPVWVLRTPDGVRLGHELVPAEGGEPGAVEVVAADAAAGPDRLGGADFVRAHGVRWPYVAGSMTQGIGSIELVTAMARAGLLAFFGAGGLDLDRVESSARKLRETLPEGVPWGVNLINNPLHPGYEDAVVDRLIAAGVTRIEASAYMTVTAPLVRYRLHGARRGPDGRVRAPHRIVAKLSREELAEQFFAPPPPRMVEALRAAGAIDADAAACAPELPLAEDVVAEADSAGHTDQRPALTLIPSIVSVRDQLHARYGYATRPRVGAAGGIATPRTVLAAFVLGADFVLTGSINQACVEAGTSEAVKSRLCQANVADVAIAPAADMFEMGVKVQVLSRGTMFHTRARRLGAIYERASGLDALEPSDRELLERRLFRRPIEAVWEETRAYFERVDPRVLAKAEASPKVKMGLVFRWYLGLSSRWAREGDPDRAVDYQIWCGPAMGAFNRWAAGTPLERPEHRSAPDLAERLMRGAVYLDRVRSLVRSGVALPADCHEDRPLGVVSPVASVSPSQ